MLWRSAIYCSDHCSICSLALSPWASPSSSSSSSPDSRVGVGGHTSPRLHGIFTAPRRRGRSVDSPAAAATAKSHGVCGVCVCSFAWLVLQCVVCVSKHRSSTVFAEQYLYRLHHHHHHQNSRHQNRSHASISSSNRTACFYCVCIFFFSERKKYTTQTETRDLIPITCFYASYSSVHSPARQPVCCSVSSLLRCCFTCHHHLQAAAAASSKPTIYKVKSDYFSVLKHLHHHLLTSSSSSTDFFLSTFLSASQSWQQLCNNSANQAKRSIHVVAAVSVLGTAWFFCFHCDQLPPPSSSSSTIFSSKHSSQQL